MAYSVKYSDNNKTAITVEDGKLNNSTPIKLPGNNYAQGYSTPVGENFIHLLENFADENPPSQPLEGQLWFDNTNVTLKYFDAVDNNGSWKDVGSITASSSAPTEGVLDGHMWLDQTDGRLYVRYNGAWLPLLSQIGDTFYINRTRTGSDDIEYQTLEMVVDGEIVAVMSGYATTWVPNSTSSPEFLEDGTTLMNTEFPTITPGITLNNGSDFRFSGTATSAEYADLAERYAVDEPVEYGNVVKLGGSKEITLETNDKSSDVFGIVSTNPGLMMNSGIGNDRTHPYIALAGRVPCRVIGIVNKGDRLVSSDVPGHARAVKPNEQYTWEHIIGRALGSNIVDTDGIVEIVVGAK